MVYELVVSVLELSVTVATPPAQSVAAEMVTSLTLGGVVVVNVDVLLRGVTLDEQPVPEAISEVI